MKRPAVAVLSTGTANTASVLAALERAGSRPRLIESTGAALRADFLVLPGVGSFAAAAERLDQLGLRAALSQRLAQDRPTLAICLGMQLLCRASEESPGALGLGLVDDTLRAFPASVRSPQFGWNRVEPTSASRWLSSGCAYFANSFRLAHLPLGWEGAFTDHGGPFVSALERGPLLGCQFHPELSGGFGAALLDRWLAGERCSKPSEVRPC